MYHLPTFIRFSMQFQDSYDHVVKFSDLPRQFQCNLCPYLTYSSYNFKRHHLRHTQERPFACGTCNKAFNHKANLKAHMRLHTGEKPFRCSKCPFSFPFQSSLRSHMLKHKWEDLSPQTQNWNSDINAAL